MSLLWIKNNYLFLLILAALVFIGYSNALNNDFVSDDITSIVQDESLKSFDYVSSRWGSARAFLYWVLFQVTGPTPLPFRLANVFFHLGTVWLVFGLLWLMTKRTLLAFLTASLFAVHPLLSEAVTWISGGAYSQVAFLTLGTFLLYLLSSQSIKLYLISLLVFWFATVTQAVSLILFPVLVVYELCFGKITRNWQKLVPYCLLSLFWIYIPLTGGIQERSTTLTSVHYQQSGVDNPLIVFPVAITSYLELIFWPKYLTLYHSEMVFSQTEYLIRVAVFLIFLAAIVYSYFKDKFITFWLLFFLLSLLPTIIPAIFRLTWIVAERYVYLGSLGILVVGGYFWAKLIAIKRWQGVTVSVFMLVLLLLSTRTIFRNVDWKNEDSLWIATSKTSPSSPNTHNNLGDVYGRRGDLPAAIREFQTAIKLKPNYADAHHNLGNAYRDAGKISEALESYQRALSFNSNLWQSHQNLAAIYFGQDNFSQALEHLQQALKINPKNSYLYMALGAVYLGKGDKEKAQEAFLTALNLDPNNLQAREGLSRTTK